MNVGSALNH